MLGHIDLLSNWNNFISVFPEYKDFEIISDLIDGEPYFSYMKYGFNKLSLSPENMEEELEFRLENDATMAKKFINFVITYPVLVSPEK